jgi:cobyrinic acid a,c-diamide synthase
VVRFDPLHDDHLPADTQGVVIGGGFPEMYAAELSANEKLRGELAAFAGPVYAECAGLLYLARELDGRPMCGVLGDVTATMAPRLTLGYRAAVAVSDSVVARTGERVRGHEFHRTAVTPGSSAPPAWTLPGGAEGFVRWRVHASYLHLHWASQPQIAIRIAGAAA